MPRAGGAAKPGGKGGLVVGIIIVVVVLAGIGVGGYFWNRSSAVSTAKGYMDASLSVFTTGKLDVAGLKGFVVADQVKDFEQLESAMGGIDAGAIAGRLSELKPSYEVQGVSAGLKEATVKVKVSMSMGGQSMARDMDLALVREGAAWKVDARKSMGAMSGGGGAGPAPKM